MAGLPPYYQQSFSTSLTSLASSSRRSITATSIYTTRSASFVPGPGELTGRGLYAFGKMALNGYQNIIVRRRLQVISSNMPHSDNSIVPGLEEMYSDLLELSRFGLYSSAIRTRALHLILRQIANEHTTQLTQSLLEWPDEETILFFSELLMCMNPAWTGLPYTRLPIHTELQKVYSSFLADLPYGVHDATPFMKFISQVANTGATGVRVIVDSGLLDVIQSIYDTTFVPWNPSYKSTTLFLACHAVLLHVARHAEDFETLCTHQVHLSWPIPIVMPASTNSEWLHHTVSDQGRDAQAILDVTELYREYEGVRMDMALEADVYLTSKMAVFEDGLGHSNLLRQMPLKPSAGDVNPRLRKDEAIRKKASIKCVLVGDGEVDKTNLLDSFATKRFPSEYVTTVFDNYLVSVMIGEDPYSLGLFNTAGQEDFDQLRTLSYAQTDVFLLCFNVTSPQSFENVRTKWFPEVHRYCPKAPYLIVGTHIDLRDDSQVVDSLARQRQFPITKECGMRLARELRAVTYVECSALTQKGLKNMFDEAIIAAVMRPPDNSGNFAAAMNRRWSKLRRGRTNSSAWTV